MDYCFLQQSTNKRTSDPFTRPIPPAHALSTHRSAEALIQKAATDSPAFRSRYASERKSRTSDKLNVDGVVKGKYLSERKAQDDRNGSKADSEPASKSERNMRLADLTVKLLGQPGHGDSIRRGSRDKLVTKDPNENPTSQVNGRLADSESEKQALLYLKD